MFKNLSTTTMLLILLGVIIVGGIIGVNWDSWFGTPSETKVTVTETDYGRCKKHTSSAGGVWYTVNGIDVDESKCIVTAS